MQYSSDLISTFGLPAIGRLKSRSDFLAAAKSKTCARGAVVAQARFRCDGSQAVRVGFTATKRIGGSVVRNRAKRRLREAARLTVPLHASVGCDYVFIARGGTTTRAWVALLDDMKTALLRLAVDLVATDRQARDSDISLGEPPLPRLLTRPE